jgi:phosphoribosyl 1,2-cyclic phosphate phosphodiesterase
LKAFESFSANGYTITPLPARHQFNEDAFIFIIEKDGKRILYANDTGYFYDNVWEYIKTNKIHFDLVSYDCTFVEIPISDLGTHMGFENIIRAKNLLKEIGAVDEKTIQIVHHFSHNGNPLHENLERLSNPLEMLVSYDGMSIEI